MRISGWSSDVCSSDLPWPMRDDDNSHQCMGAAAIFGALPAIDAGLVRLDTHDVASAGHHVQLARQARPPEAVDDIVRSEERRGGKEGVSKCSSRWAPYH